MQKFKLGNIVTHIEGREGTGELDYYRQDGRDKIKFKIINFDPKRSEGDSNQHQLEPVIQGSSAHCRHYGNNSYWMNEESLELAQLPAISTTEELEALYAI